MIRNFFVIIDHPIHLDQQSLIQIISDMGIDFISCIQESSQTVNFQLSNNKLTTDSNANWGFGFYMLHGVRDGFYSQNDYTRSTTGIVDIARQLLKTTPSNEISNPPQDGKKRSTVHDIRSEGPINGDLFDNGNMIISSIRSKLEDLENLNYHVELRCQDVKKSIQNSEESNIIHLYNKAKIAIELIDKYNPENSISFDSGGIQRSECDINHILKLIDKNYNILQAKRDAKKIDSDRYQVVLSGDTTYSLIHESIGHGCEADQVISNQSFLSKKIGYKVGSSNLTVTDDPHLRGVGWAEYDDEGTKTKGTLLVEDGILVDFLHTRKTAKILGYPNTGNARTTTYLEKPDARQSNIFVEPKDYSLEELVEEVDNGYFLGPTSIASTSIFTGEMYIQVQYGREIVNGELGEYTAPLTMTGNALNLLSNITQIGSEITKFPTECSKSNSRIDIGAYTPEIALESALLE